MHRSVSCISTARHGTGAATPLPLFIVAVAMAGRTYGWSGGHAHDDDADADDATRAVPAHYFSTVRYRTPAQLALQSPPLQLQCTSATHSRSDRSPTATPTHACIHREKTLSHVRTYVRTYPYHRKLLQSSAGTIRERNLWSAKQETTPCGVG